MGRIILLSCIVSYFMNVCLLSAEERTDSLLVMFWNMENFFDYTDSGGGESDKEYSSYGSRRWTKGRFLYKCSCFAKALYWISDRYGRIPDVIGLAEIENRRVLTGLLSSTTLGKKDYKVIHRDSGDRRGIDVALLYREGTMNCEYISFRHVICQGDTLDTRDILHARLSYGDSSCIDFIVNHHPSKYGGAKDSEIKRKAAMLAMKELCDSLTRADNKTEGIVSMGDFNDTPDSDNFRIIDGILTNKAVGLHAEGEGTIRYEGKWELIDMFLVSHGLDALTEMHIQKIPFLMARDNVHVGEKPLRTYSGPRYMGGVSDHCPILLWIFNRNCYL